MKVVLILFSILLLFQISFASPSFRKSALLASFKDFVLEKVQSIESSKIREVLSFLEKNFPTPENKLDAFAPIFIKYFQMEKEAKQQNESIFFYVMVI